MCMMRSFNCIVIVVHTGTVCTVVVSVNNREADIPCPWEFLYIRVVIRCSHLMFTSYRLR